MTVEPSAAQQIDVYPTILSAVGVTGASVEGVDLRSQVPNERLAVALLEREGRHLESVVYRNFKLISDPGGRGGFDRGAASVLFDLEKDPGEQDDLADRRPVLAGYLERLLRDRSRQRDVGDAPAPEVSISREVEETLKALGYVE
jgi:arylsulfatase A-like enzyme